MVRIDGREPNALRPLRFDLGVQPHANGSCVVSMGETRVLCAVTIEERVPRWLQGRGRGWLTAEYAMLPAATNTRSDRERMLSTGRTKEIQRLIGRSLRAAVDLEAIGERTVTVDCDVLHADGGTRTASINGAYVALSGALSGALGERAEAAIRRQVGAVSLGLLDGQALVDLNYAEDSAADVDFNVVGLSDGGLVEVQGTAEGRAFSAQQLSELVGLAQAALEEVFAAQRNALDQK